MGTRNKAVRELLAAIRLPTIPAVFQALSYSGGSPQLAKLGVLPIRTRKFEARYLSSAAHLVLTNDKRHAQQQQRQVQLSDVVRASMALRLPLLGVSLQHAPLPLLQTPLPSRQISFLRYLSAGPPDQRHRLPSAADADAALQDYLALKQRLDQVQRPSSIKTPGQVLKDLAVGIKNGVLVVSRFLGSVPARVAAFNAMSKEEWAAKKKAMWATVKHEAHHYWVGTKLLGYEVRIAARHALKAAQGKTLSRRERAQLTRTTADLFRLVPMIIIVVIPFLEFALPVLLRIFPNMLPSTFEDKLKKEEELKRRLSLRLELARFLQDTTAEMAKDIARRRGSNTEAAELDVFLKKVRSGQEVENAEIIRFARLFNDELTLDNLERLQLVSMCQFVGISPFGTDSFLRSRLRAHLATIKQDDCEIEEEGLENLTEEELRSACRARGIRTPFGEGAVRFMQRQLQDWLDLSLHRGLPSSLLLLSRAFTITAAGQQAASRDVGAAKDAQYAKLKETLGVLPEEVVDVVSEEQLGGSGVEALQKRLDFLKREEEAIRAELERTAAAERAAAAAAAATTASSKAAADIMHNEMNRVSSVLAKTGKGSSTGTMSFSARGLEVAKDPVVEPGQPHAPGQGHESEVPSQLGERVSRMLASIEQELDSVETKIGRRLHVLDTDQDGMVTHEELEQAMGFLRAQMDPDQLQQLLVQLREAASKGAASQPTTAIAVSELLKLASEQQDNGGELGDMNKARK
ncbi:LETM1-like protein-domain-containing protein [Haematococcus lacustris]